MKKLIFLTVFLFSIVSIHAKDISLTTIVGESNEQERITWVGSGNDSNFSNPDNWLHGKVPGENDVAQINTQDEVIIDVNVKVKQLFINPGSKLTVKGKGDKGIIKIETSYFLSFGTVSVDENWGLNFEGIDQNYSHWTNSGDIRGGRFVTVGNSDTGTPSFSSADNSGLIFSENISIKAETFDNDGEVYSNVILNVETTGDFTNKREILLTNEFSDKTLGSIQIKCGGLFKQEDEGSITTFNRGSNSSGKGSINIQTKDLSNLGTISSSDAKTDGPGAKVEIFVSNEFINKKDAKILSGGGLGANPGGLIEIRADKLRQKGTILVGKKGTAAPIPSFVHMFTSFLEIDGFGHSIFGNSSLAKNPMVQKSSPTPADTDFPVYIYAKEINISAEEGEIDVQSLWITGEDIVFDNVATDGIKSSNQISIQTKAGGSLNFSALSNTNSLSANGQISVTNSNLTEPPGGFVPVFNKAPSVVSPNNGWQGILPLANILGVNAGSGGEAHLSLFNPHFQTQTVEVDFRSANGWASTGSASVTIPPFGMESVLIPFTIPDDANTLDTETILYDLAFGSFNLQNQGMIITCIGEKPPDLPQRVILAEPANNNVGTIIRPDFSWTGSLDSDYYVIEVSSDEDHNDVVVRTVTQQAEFSLDSPLSTNTMYYWRVYSANQGGIGEWSETWMFTTEMTSSSEPLENTTSINVYPNPVTEYLVFENISAEAGKVHLEVLDLKGRRLFHEEKQIDSNNGNIRFNTTQLSNGIYLYNFYFNGNRKTGRFIIAK